MNRKYLPRAVESQRDWRLTVRSSRQDVQIPNSRQLTPSAVAHNAIAETLDQVFTYSVTGRAQRDIVWRELDRCFHPGQRVLELDCGTGVDAAHLASRGVEVYACEESSKLRDLARNASTRLKWPYTSR